MTRPGAYVEIKNVMIAQLTAVKILQACRTFELGGAAFCLGDQKSLIGEEWAKTVRERIRAGEDFSDVPDRGDLIKPEDFFTLCGFSSFADIDYNGQAKITLDWGLKLPREMHGQADLLFDGGCIEHIPNIYQAMCNNMLFLKKGGVLLEGVPAACFGESYYNIDPLLFRDFYGANGFEMVECFLLYNKTRRATPMQRVKTKMRQAAKAVLRPLLPNSVKTFGKQKLEERETRKNVEDRGKSALGNLATTAIIDPFHRDSSVLGQMGLPPRTHVFYVGRKVRDIDPDAIAVPRQHAYPSAI